MMLKGFANPLNWSKSAFKEPTDKSACILIGILFLSAEIQIAKLSSALKTLPD